jgi:hypothetical protein
MLKCTVTNLNSSFLVPVTKLQRLPIQHSSFFAGIRHTGSYSHNNPPIAGKNVPTEVLRFKCHLPGCEEKHCYKICGDLVSVVQVGNLTSSSVVKGKKTRHIADINFVGENKNHYLNEFEDPEPVDVSDFSENGFATPWVNKKEIRDNIYSSPIFRENIEKTK